VFNLDYIDVAKARMSLVSTGNPIDRLIETGAGNVTVSNFYTKEEFEVVVVEDSSDDFTDEKVLYCYVGSFLEGDVIEWDNSKWILFQEEKNTKDDYRKFFMVESLSVVNFLVDGVKSKSHPISFLKSSYGNKSTRAGSRFFYTANDSSINLIINKNSDTETLEQKDELIINKTVWEVDIINSYESQSVIAMGLSRIRASNSDDLDGNIANTFEGITGSSIVYGDYTYTIVGEPKIRLGAQEVYEVKKIDANGNRVEPTSVSFSTSSPLVILAQNGNKATITPGEMTGSFTLRALADGKSITANLEIVGFWG